MNDIDEFFGVTIAIFAVITCLMIWLTYLEKTLYRPSSRRIEQDRSDRQ